MTLSEVSHDPIASHSHQTLARVFAWKEIVNRFNGLLWVMGKSFVAPQIEVGHDRKTVENGLARNTALKRGENEMIKVIY